MSATRVEERRFFDPGLTGLGPARAPVAIDDDPLHASMRLPLHQVFFPLGFPAVIRTNDAGIFRAAELSWGTSVRRFREAPIEVRFLVSGIPTRRKPPPPIFRAQSNLLSIVADAHNFASCDLAAGFGFAWVTKAAIKSHDYIRYHFLDAMVYALLDTQHVVAIHAACVEKGGSGVLLLGDSGAGKSSFAYACAKRGWTYISDDASSLAMCKAGRTVVGNPGIFRFRPAVTSLFPELSGQTKLRNGKPTVEIRTDSLKHIQVAGECTVDHIVFLNRLPMEPEQVHLSPVSRKDALTKLARNNWPAELTVQDKRTEAIERLLGAQAHQLTYSAFDPAIEVLEAAVGRTKL